MKLIVWARWLHLGMPLQNNHMTQAAAFQTLRYASQTAPSPDLAAYPELDAERRGVLGKCG